jgi:2-Cys peroxiredoxin 5
MAEETIFAKPLCVGDSLPSVDVVENADLANKVNIASIFSDKKGVLFGVPGAFTPG